MTSSNLYRRPRYADRYPPYISTSPNLSSQQNPMKVKWFDPYISAQLTVRRLETPLQYHLRQHDVVAAFAELRRGADPCLRDECGRTVLDLAFQMAVDILEASFCTSFPVDAIAETLHDSLLFPVSSFVHHYDDIYGNLYEQPRRMQMEDLPHSLLSAPPSSSSNFRAASSPITYTPKPFPPYDSPFGRSSSSGGGGRPPIFPPPPSSPTSGKLRSRREAKNVGGSDVDDADPSIISTQQQCERIIDVCDGAFPSEGLYAGWEGGRISSTVEDRKYDSISAMMMVQPNIDSRVVLFDTCVVIRDTLQRPLSSKLKFRMRDLLRRLRALCQFIRHLSICECLREKSEEWVSELWHHFPHPFLYSSLIDGLFEYYPSSPGGVKWDQRNPADARRLVNIIMEKKFRGASIIRFLGCSVGYFVELIKAGGEHLFCVSPGMAQFFMHMGFVLDSVALFEFATRQQHIFHVGDLFKWDDMLFTLLEYRRKFPKFFATLMHLRLKERIRRRLGSREDGEEQTISERVQAPFEPRFLTTNVLNNFAEIFSPAEAQELESFLKEWRYGAIRVQGEKSKDSSFSKPFARDVSQTNTSSAVSFNHSASKFRSPPSCLP